jgi:hypothetical protein
MLYVGSERVKERSQYSKYSPTHLMLHRLALFCYSALVQATTLDTSRARPSPLTFV